MDAKPLTLVIKKPEDVQVKNPYTIISWNINGYSDDIHLWLSAFLTNIRPDIMFLNETKRKEEYLKPLFDTFKEYNYIINSHQPAHWHGVAMLIRKDHKYQHISVQMNIVPRSDTKSTEAGCGRIILIHLNAHLYILATYVPNSGGTTAKIEKYQFRTCAWDPTLVNLLEQLRKLGNTIWIGDINVALDDIDVSHPKQMAKCAGFTPDERANLRKFLSTGDWIDIWRHQHPTERKYSWGYSNERGMRLDNIIVSKSLLPHVSNSFMIENCPLSADHIPITICLNSDKL